MLTSTEDKRSWRIFLWEHMYDSMQNLRHGDTR